MAQQRYSKTFNGDHAYSPSDAAVSLNGSAIAPEGICPTHEDDKNDMILPK